MTQKISILGGGVAGLCVATELASRGFSITIIDPEDGPGEHACSWWAGGMLAPFCESETAEEPVTRLGQEAADWWEAQGVEAIRNGSLVIALNRDRKEIDRFARRTTGHEAINSARLAELEPHLAERFERALFVENEAHINPRPALLKLHQNLAQKGVIFSKTESSLDGTIIDCRGLAAKDKLDNLRGVKGEMVILKTNEIELSRPVRLLHPRFPLYIVPRGDGVFMLGATQIESGEREGATVRSVMELLNSAYALHPAFGEAQLLEIGVDARPAFPDNLPGICQKEGRIFVNGLFRHGYLLAPVLARMTAEFLIDGTIPELMQ